MKKKKRKDERWGETAHNKRPAASPGQTLAEIRPNHCNYRKGAGQGPRVARAILIGGDGQTVPELTGSRSG